MTVALPRALDPLRHRGFRMLAAGQLASNIGDAFYAVALPWYVLTTHGGVLLLGSVLAAYGIPRVAMLAIGGHLSDRWRPWTVMMGADAVRALAVGALAAVALTGPASAPVLLPLAAVIGAGEGLFLPGSFSIVPALLPDGDLQAGNALSSGGTQLAMLAGPAIGGAAVAALGPGPAFVVDAGSFVISAFSLLALRANFAPAPPAQKPPGQPLLTNSPLPGPTVAPTTLWRVVTSERVLQVILLVTLAANLGSGGMSEVALPALARGPLRSGAGGYGALIAAFGGGALVGTLLAAQSRRPSRPGLLGSAVFLLECAFMAIVPYLGGVPLAGAALALTGLLNGFGNVVTITAFQRWAPPALLGRLMGLLMVGSFGVFPLSVLAGGAIVHTLGPAVFFPLASALLALAVLGGLTQPSWRHFGSEQAPARGVGASATGTPAHAGSTNDLSHGGVGGPRAI